jgi:hypothetical protein
LYRSLLTDASFYELLCRIDADLAATARAADCPDCSGRLDCADYPRKPRGGPETLGVEYASRYSFCCARDGCRRRTTPPSVRFLGRRVYLGAIVVLATALQHGPTPTRIARLRQLLGMSAKTLGRWRAWWQEAFVASHCWKAARSRFDRPVSETGLPASLLERFGGDAAQRLVGVLRVLVPLTTTSAPRRFAEGRR